MSARERIEFLLDEGTFEETDKLVTHRCRDFGMDEQLIPGDGVVAGQRLGAIEDLFGDERHAILAPEDGTVLFMTSVPAVDRNGILCGLGTRREAA